MDPSVLEHTTVGRNRLNADGRNESKQAKTGREPGSPSYTVEKIHDADARLLLPCTVAAVPPGHAGCPAAGDCQSLRKTNSFTSSEALHSMGGFPSFVSTARCEAYFAGAGAA